MEFLIFNIVYKIIGLLLALLVIWLVISKFRKIILKDEIFCIIKDNDLALAIYEGLLFVGMVILASKVVP